MKKTVITISVVAVMAVAVACIFCTVKANENPFLNANAEAQAMNEAYNVKTCYTEGVWGSVDYIIVCDSNTNSETLYSCASETLGRRGVESKCIND